MAEIIKTARIPALVDEKIKQKFIQGLDNLRDSVNNIKKAGEIFASIPDKDWKILKSKIDGEAQKWAENARNVIKKNMHPAFALMNTVLGRKARKLPPKDQVRILREPLEIAMLDEGGRIVDKYMKLASELNLDELKRVIPEDNTKAWIATPKEQASRFRAELKRLEVKTKATTQVEIKKPAYVINNKGITLSSKVLSFAKLKELYEDAEKLKNQLNSKS